MTLFLPAEQRVEVIRDYAKRYGIKHLIESGTSVGDTPNALMDDFTTLTTIELDPGLYVRAVQRFAGSKVQCMMGDSGRLLPGLLVGLTEPVIFWLDGHHSGPGTAHGDLDTPIVAELTAAVAAPKGSVILIDDARIFAEGPEHFDEPHYHDYPPLSWVRDKAQQSGFDYEMKDDIIRITPR